MKLFITGSESFIGARLWDMCRQAGHEVTGIDLAPPRQTGGVRLDLRDPKLTEHVPADAAVIHLAAVSTDQLCKADPAESLDVNITGTLRVAQAARARGCPQFIFASTEWVYGDADAGQRQSEEDAIDVTRMHGPYAFSKIVGERLLSFAGLANLTILRFGIVYGPREKNWSAVESLLEKVRQGQPLQVGSLKTSRKFIHVDDLCAGILASIGQKGLQIFNLPGASQVTLGEIAQTSQRVLGKTVSVTETNQGGISVRNPDGSKAQRVLGWTPRVSFEDGVRQLVQYLEKRAKP